LQQLLDALMRQPQQLPGIPDAESRAGQAAHCLSGSGLCSLALMVRSRTGSPLTRQQASEIGGESNVIQKLCALGPLHEEAEGLANARARLSDGPALRVAARNAAYGCYPPPS
jgi:hypothetical protein